MQFFLDHPCPSGFSRQKISMLCWPHSTHQKPKFKNLKLEVFGIKPIICDQWFDILRILCGVNSIRDRKGPGPHPYFVWDIIHDWLVESLHVLPFQMQPCSWRIFLTTHLSPTKLIHWMSELKCLWFHLKMNALRLTRHFPLQQVRTSIRGSRNAFAPSNLCISFRFRLCLRCGLPHSHLWWWAWFLALFVS